MRKYFLLSSFFLFTTSSFSQTDSVETFFAFRITDYTVKLSDTATVVQVNIPGAWPVKIKNEQPAVLKYRYENNKPIDTSIIGFGRCHLIKQEFNYFTIIHKKKITPEQGNLLYTKITVPCLNNGLLFKTGSHAIHFTRVTDEQFYYPVEIFSLNKQKETQLLDSMVADIHYTGKAMKQQTDGQDQVIKGGLYNGKGLFEAMQQVTREELGEFLEYVIARPSKYAGNVWKIAEVFATWMVGETPRVIK